MTTSSVYVACRCAGARINVWQPPHRIEDEQLRGPYRQWINTHTFEPYDSGMLARDVVQYAVSLDFIAHPLFVHRDIQKIFTFRQEMLRKHFLVATRR